jgi:hypothetical protein
MTSIDVRRRFEGDAVAVDPAAFFEDTLPGRLSETAALAARGKAVLGLPPVTFDVEGSVYSLDVHEAVLGVVSGEVDGAMRVRLDAGAFSDLVQDVVSMHGLTMSGRIWLDAGNFAHVGAWDPVLRAAIDGWPVHEPGAVQLRGRDGRDLDVHRSFRLDRDPVEEIGYFLAEAGYLHLVSVFTDDEMDAVAEELDAAVREAERDDGASWWARTTDGEWYAARILGFNLKSPTLRALLKTDRFRAVGHLTDDTMVQRDPDSGDSAEGLTKKVGVVEGISDVPWHKDCSPGGHTIRCRGLTVGISVSGADERSGELGVVAGSNRANVAAVTPDLDLTRVPLPTRTGDLTVHCSCTFHMSRPPVERGRKVVYTGFGQAPRPGDHYLAMDPAEIRRRRAALNDLARGRTEAPTVDSPEFALEDRAH